MPDSLRPETDYSACDYRSDDLAKEMLANLIGEKNFDIDDIEWDDSKITVPEDLMSSWKTNVDPVTIEELTSRKLFGSGIFDALMEAVSVHLKREYDANRITGAEYAKAYVALSETALTNAVQFTLNKNQAYFQGILAQAQAITAGINAQIAALTAKVQLAKTKAEALGVAAQYALTAMKLSTEDARHALVCKQLITQGEQAALVHQQSIAAKYQAEMLNPKPAPTDIDADGNPTNVDYQNKKLQMEDQKAQTAIRELQLQANQPETPIKLDENGDPVLVNGEPVEIENGNIDFLTKVAQKERLENQSELEGAQKELYEQQKISYIRQDEKNVAEVFSNAYISMKSIDEGLSLPKAFSGGSINEVLQKLKTNVNLGRDNTNISEYTIEDTLFTGNSDIDVKEEGQTPTIDPAEVFADKAFDQNGVIKAVEEETEEEGNNG